MWTVDWLQSALDELADIWNQADSTIRRDITSACHEIDQRLSRNPHTEGESRTGDRRLLFVHPLGVLYRVDSQDSKVEILHVWRYA
jgi:hypothetical protein